MLLFCLFYFPQNTVHFIIVYSSVEIILKFFINRVQKLRYSDTSANEDNSFRNHIR